MVGNFLSFLFAFSHSLIGNFLSFLFDFLFDWKFSFFSFLLPRVRIMVSQDFGSRLVERLVMIHVRIWPAVWG